MRAGLAMLGAAALALVGCERAAEAPAEAPAADNGTAAGPAAPAGADAPAVRTEAPVARDAAEFAALAAAADLYAIEAARLAVDRAESVAVKALARAILADRRRSGRSLAAAARAAEPPVSAAARLRPEQQALLERLRRASGAAFDEEYLRQQVEANERVLGLMTAYMVGGDAPSLQRHAADSAEPVQRHLSRARELAERAAAPDDDRTKE